MRAKTLLPELTPEQRTELARHWRVLRKVGLIRPARERHEMRKALMDCRAGIPVSDEHGVCPATILLPL